MTSKNIRLCSLVILILGMVFFYSCNSDSGSTSQNDAEHKKDTVSIIGMKFEPENITVKKGDTVVFVNNDIFAHNVTEKDSAWQSPVLNPNDVWQYIPDKSYDYFCSLHLVMKGKITVE